MNQQDCEAIFLWISNIVLPYSYESAVPSLKNPDVLAQSPKFGEQIRPCEERPAGAEDLSGPKGPQVVPSGPRGPKGPMGGPWGPHGGPYGIYGGPH